MPKNTPFKSIVGSLKNRNVLIFCPGKNILEWSKRVKEFVVKSESIVIACNKISNIIDPEYHLFTNNDKYNHYGDQISINSKLILGSYVKEKYINKHNNSYIRVKYTDRNVKEKLSYDEKRDIIKGYYRTSGNLAIMMAHLMGAKNIYVAGMSGFMFQFDGNVHYYPNELKRSDFKTQQEWLKKYDVPIYNCLNKMKKMGIKFKIITPTFYDDHFDGTILAT